LLQIPFALVAGAKNKIQKLNNSSLNGKPSWMPVKALDEREKSLPEREKLTAEPRVPVVVRIVPAQPQRSVPSELKA